MWSGKNKFIPVVTKNHARRQGHTHERDLRVWLPPLRLTWPRITQKRRDACEKTRSGEGKSSIQPPSSRTQEIQTCQQEALTLGLGTNPREL